MFRQAKKIIVFLLIMIILSCSLCVGVSADSWPVVFEANKMSEFLLQTDYRDGHTPFTEQSYSFRNTASFAVNSGSYIKDYLKQGMSLWACFPEIKVSSGNYYKFHIPFRSINYDIGSFFIIFEEFGFLPQYVYEAKEVREFTEGGYTYRDYIFEGTLTGEQIEKLYWIEIVFEGPDTVLQLGIVKDDKITFQLSGDLNSQYIVDNEKQNQENEKNEANDTGANGVGELNDLIPNDTDGLLSAFSNLTRSMIHNDTTCKIDFPGIKIPKLVVQGMEIGNVTLLEPQEIDFEYYFTLIPEIYIKLIRGLCTCGLIIYCFKEMYSLLKMIFTAKGGGDSE